MLRQQGQRSVKSWYYANMEVPVSCMETEIIAGKNAALLAAARVAA